MDRSAAFLNMGGEITIARANSYDDGLYRVQASIRVVDDDNANHLVANDTQYANCAEDIPDTAKDATAKCIAKVAGLVRATNSNWRPSSWLERPALALNKTTPR